MTELGIYFAAAVRGGADFSAMARRIAFLESIGRVTTRHMASPKRVDLGEKSDQAIYAHDQSLLEESQVFIADLAAPSTGTGFMAARAVEKKMPVLCLYPEGTKLSAMIAGCPEITTERYAGEADFERRVRAFLIAHAAELSGLRFRGLKILLAGPPGAGKGTLGEALARSTGAAHVSSGELLRQLVKRPGTPHPHAALIETSMREGRLVPAEVMRDIVLERLGLPDARMFGFLLDGYPPSYGDLLNLRTGGVEPDLVLYLDVADATARARQVKRAARSTDTPEKAEHRLQVFHEADLGFDTLASKWFPNSVVVRIDAEQSPQAVEAFASSVMAGLFGNAERAASWSPIPPHRPDAVRSTRVHFHVDAPNVAGVRDVARAVYARHKAAQGQIKIYPIAALHLGPQASRLPIYRRMPNFHAFADSDSEAFITGRLGDGDEALMRAVLESTREKGGMAELEEYVGEWTLKADGTPGARTVHAPLDLGLAPYAEFNANLLGDLPRLELHHGFDVPKSGADLPIALGDLAARCAARGFDNGGWFIFKNEQHFAYRSNEFSSVSIPEATRMLEAQAQALHDILRAANITADLSYSLEIVHGIWVF